MVSARVFRIPSVVALVLLLACALPALAVAPSTVINFPPPDETFGLPISRMSGVTYTNGGPAVSVVYLRVGKRLGGVVYYWRWSDQTWISDPDGSEFRAATGTASWEVTDGFPVWENFDPYGISYLAEAYAINEAGTASFMPQNSFRFALITGPDTTPPLVAITYPAEGRVVSPPASIGGNSSDTAGSGVAIVACRLGRGGTYWNWQTGGWVADPADPAVWATASGTTLWHVTAPPLDTGTYTVSAYADDLAGNRGIATDVTFQVDATPPVVNILSPQMNQHYWPPPALYGTASDPESGITSVRCQLIRYIDNWDYRWDWTEHVWKPFGDRWTYADGTDNWQLTRDLPTDWPIGDRLRLNVIAMNRLGQETTAYVFFWVGETEPPTCTVTYPADGGNYYGGLTHIEGTASDAITGVAVVKCILSKQNAISTGILTWNWTTASWDTAESAATVIDATGTTNWSVAGPLPTAWDGKTYWVRAVAYDHHGNAGMALVDFTCRDFSPPTVAITEPTDGATYFPGPPRFYGTASDNASWIARVVAELRYMSDTGAIRYYNWTTGLWQTTSTDQTWTTANGTEQWEVLGLPSQWPVNACVGATARAYDAAGNSNQTTTYSYIKETTPPTGAITYPVSGVLYYPGITSITGTAADSGSGVAEVSCHLSRDDPAGRMYWDWSHQYWVPGLDYYGWRRATGTTNWVISDRLPATFPMNQTYYATAQIVDACGNAAVVTNQFTIGDYTPPVITRITATPSTLSNVNGKLVNAVVSVTATDNADPAPVSRITTVTANQAIDGPEAGSRADWVLTGNLTLQLRAERTGAAARIYTIRVTCTDRCGNSATGTVNVTVPKKK